LYYFALKYQVNTNHKQNYKLINDNYLAQTIKYKVPRGFLTPQRVYRTILNNYFIDAIYDIPVNVYPVHLLTNDFGTTTTPTTPNTSGSGNETNKTSTPLRIKDYSGLSFCQRIEIGSYVESLLFKKEQKLEDNISLDEMKTKGFKDPKTLLNITFTSMDTSETTFNIAINEPAKIYQSIIIKNVSKPGDKGPIANPNTSWLEVTLIDDAILKKKKKNRETEQCISIHVDSITIESQSVTKFPILMDGELYGPFHKLIIESKNRIKFDLMTFQKLNNIEPTIGPLKN